MTHKIWGWLGMNSQLILVTVGLASQAWKLYKGKSAGELSLFYFGFCFWTSFCYFNHGYFEVHNKYIYVPQIPGMFFGGFMIWLIINYRYFYPRRAPVSVRVS